MEEAAHRSTEKARDGVFITSKTREDMWSLQEEARGDLNSKSPWTEYVRQHPAPAAGQNYYKHRVTGEEISGESVPEVGIRKSYITGNLKNTNLHYDVWRQYSSRKQNSLMSIQALQDEIKASRQIKSPEQIKREKIAEKHKEARANYKKRSPWQEKVWDKEDGESGWDYGRNYYVRGEGEQKERTLVLPKEGIRKSIINNSKEKSEIYLEWNEKWLAGELGELEDD